MEPKNDSCENNFKQSVCNEEENLISPVTACVDEEKANLKGDFKNAALLVVLYLFQGVPLGLCAAIPILLQNRGASYKEQAIFTAAYYPFSSEF